MARNAELAGGFSAALDVLDAAWDAFTQRALEDGFVWWLGTGVSFDALPATGRMVLGALVTLQARYTETSDPAYADAFIAALAMVGREDIPVELPAEEWVELDDLLDALAAKYSAIFECIEPYVRGKADLVLDIIRIPEVYGSGGLEPDAEHRFLAALIAEGVITEVVSTNWDPLVELAYESAVDSPSLAVVAHPDDIGAGRPRIVKMHGCAKLAFGNRDKYGRCIVVTAEQVDAWAEAVPQLKEAIYTVLRERPALFLGCSARDNDIKQAMMLARERYEPFPVDVPRAVFATEALTTEYEAILSRLHGDAFAGDDAVRLRSLSVLPMRAKELLGALLVECLQVKGRTLLRSTAPPLAQEWVDLWDARFGALRATLDGRYSALPAGERWREVARELIAASSRFASIYRRNAAPSDEWAYVPLVSGSVAEVAGDGAIKFAGFHLPLIGLLAVTTHAEQQAWQCSVPTGAEVDSGSLVLDVGGVTSRVFFMSHSVYDYVKLVESGAIEEDLLGDCLFVFARGPAPDDARNDVYRPKLPSRNNAEQPKWLSVDTEILSPGLSVDEAVQLIADRVPVGGAV